MVNPRAWLAEAIGTYALVFFGPLAITIAIAMFDLGLGADALVIISFASSHCPTTMSPKQRKSYNRG